MEYKLSYFEVSLYALHHANLAVQSGRILYGIQHSFRGRASLRPGRICCHLLQILDINQSHLELGHENTCHYSIIMIRFFCQFSSIFSLTVPISSAPFQLFDWQVIACAQNWMFNMQTTSIYNESIDNLLVCTV